MGFSKRCPAVSSVCFVPTTVACALVVLVPTEQVSTPTGREAVLAGGAVTPETDATADAERMFKLMMDKMDDIHLDYQFENSKKIIQ